MEKVAAVVVDCLFTPPLLLLIAFFRRTNLSLIFLHSFVHSSTCKLTLAEISFQEWLAICAALYSVNDGRKDRVGQRHKEKVRNGIDGSSRRPERVPLPPPDLLCHLLLHLTASALAVNAPSPPRSTEPSNGGLPNPPEGRLLAGGCASPEPTFTTPTDPRPFTEPLFSKRSCSLTDIYMTAGAMMIQARSTFWFGTKGSNSWPWLYDPNWVPVRCPRPIFWTDSHNRNHVRSGQTWRFVSRPQLRSKSNLNP
ncbi:unnamed protein product [Pleuronectes platessa]|uniref:Uncharacterized protein n=1 Tax=Pleuronectes platessa TaxID=8262 RepID=A0A9N7UDM6_PLEPL|nr:unnamed protein product [Pleuronectes platessa]